MHVFQSLPLLCPLANILTRFYTTLDRHQDGPNTKGNLLESRKMLLVTLLWSAGLALGSNLVLS